MLVKYKGAFGRPSLLIDTTRSLVTIEVCSEFQEILFT